MAFPSSVWINASLKYFLANSETKYILSFSEACSFSSEVCSVSSISILYFFAKYLMASGYEKCSCSIKNETTFPPFPELKSFQICLTGETINEGDFSSVKGLSPLRLLPERLSCTKSPMTSSTRATSKTVSIVFFEIILFRSKTQRYFFQGIENRERLIELQA